MDILIKNVEMPLGCKECIFYNSIYTIEGVRYYCRLTSKTIDNNWVRMDDCPLVELPPHGRLIDADALCNKLKSPDFAYFSVAKYESIIDKAKTIVEASNVTDN